MQGRTKDDRKPVVTLLYLTLAFSLLSIHLMPARFAWPTITRAAAAEISKRPLSQSDFKYLGAILMPGGSADLGDVPFGRGLTHRYVNGELHMFSSGWNPQSIYEVRVPAPSLTSPFPSATVVRNWGSSWWHQSYTAVP